MEHAPSRSQPHTVYPRYMSIIAFVTDILKTHTATISSKPDRTMDLLSDEPMLDVVCG